MEVLMKKVLSVNYQGIFPAAMTMFDKDGNLDESATLEHWKWLAGEGIHGLVIAGTSGEFIALTREERQRLFELAVSQFKGKLPILAGTGHYSTKLTIEMCQKAQAAGADAFIVITPYYMNPPKPAILEHYRIVRRHTDLPIMLYHNPRNSACVELAPAEIAQLVDEDVVHMVKSTFESVVPVHDLFQLAGDRMRIFYGSFLSSYEGLMGGAHGWISGILNVVPSQAVAMFDAIKVEKNIEKAFSIWMKILSIVHLWSRNEIGPVSDITIYRAILEFWGRRGGYSRLPLFPLNDEQKKKLRSKLEATGWDNYKGLLELGEPARTASGR
jgi:4-hydroxy-tetrahydrodipicolinate synthase